MKKYRIYLIIVMCLFIVGCGSNSTRNVKTLEEFETIAINEGFEIKDTSQRYASASYIEEAMIARYDEIEVEMIRYTTTDYAEQVQEQHIDSFITLKSTGATAEKEKGNNYYDFALISNGRYMVTTRVDNTLIFAKVLVEEREIVDNLINLMGY